MKNPWQVLTEAIRAQDWTKKPWAVAKPKPEEPAGVVPLEIGKDYVLPIEVSAEIVREIGKQKKQKKQKGK